MFRAQSINVSAVIVRNLYYFPNVALKVNNLDGQSLDKAVVNTKISIDFPIIIILLVFLIIHTIISYIS